MLISNSHRFVFIHVPKTGGTSMVKALKKHADRPPLPLRLIGYFFDDRGHKLPPWTFDWVGYPYHVSAGQLVAKWGHDRFSSYFSFGFVRNPWDLVVSEYKYILRRRVHPMRREVLRLRNFEEFVRWKSVHYARPQAMWLCDEKDNVLVKRVYRFESYSQEAKGLFDRLGVEGEVPHENATVRSGYDEYYSAETRDLVAKMYSRDVSLFGYTF